MSRVAAILAGILLLRGAEAGAQSVRGRVTDADHGRPTIGAIVSLVNSSDGRRVSPAITDESGTYLVTAPVPGRYRLRIDHIGYAAWTSDEVGLTAGDTLVRDVRLPLRRAILPTVTVQGASTCVTNPQDVPGTLAVWEEIRRALMLSELSRGSHRQPFELDVTERFVTSERVFGIRGRERVRSETVRPWSTPTAADLAANGYVRRDRDSLTFFGPSIEVLLSDEFLGTHCFGLVRQQTPTGSLVGLSFEPVAGRRVPDLAGAIWLDETTSELRAVDFTFERSREALPSGAPPGGRLEFDRLASGLWYIKRWLLRLPASALTLTNGSAGNSGPLPGNGAARDAWWARVAPYRERRGEALPLGSPAVDTARGVARISGIVIDSTSDLPLIGATIRLPGVAPVRSDSAGRFSVIVPGLSADTVGYVLAVEHPRFDVIGLAGVERTVPLWAGATPSVELATPSLPSLLRAGCPVGKERLVDAHGAPVVGILSVSVIVAPEAQLPDSLRLVAEWPSDEGSRDGMLVRTQRRATMVPASGRVRLCPLPLDRPLRLHLEAAGVRGPDVETSLPPTGFLARQLPWQP